MKRILLAGLLGFSSLFTASPSQAAELPKVVSFDFSPKEIEVTGADTTVSFELVVSHPNGIDNISTIVKVSDASGNFISDYLTRTDNPIVHDSKPVTFKGKVTIPRTLAIGAYSVTVNGVSNFNSTGYSFSTGEISPKSFRELVGAESSLIIRSGGFANIDYTTFAGPSYDNLTSHSFKNTTKYNAYSSPIFKVGESYDPNDYFESYVPSLPLKVSTTTSAVCSTDGKALKFISEGSCQFKVFTEKTKDYMLQESEQIANITSARMKSTFVVSTVASQTSKDLPKSVTLPEVYSAAAGYVLPISLTPSVCIASGFTAKIISGGTCTLTYQTIATKDYLVSDLYKQTFEITRDPQTLTFDVPAIAKVGSKGLTLAAVASSSGSITYSATPTSVCSTSGSTLDFKGKGTCQVTATQAGTTTIAPISVTKSIAVSSASIVKKTITCVKGSKKIKTTASKCPKGYKKK